MRLFSLLLAPEGRLPGISLLLLACSAIAASAAGVAPSTQRMIERITELDRRANPLVNPYLTGRAVEVYRQKIAQRPPPRELLELRMLLATALLNDGQPAAALKELDAYDEMLNLPGLAPTAAQAAQFFETKAVAHLRVGELENCLENHNADSCLFPIKDGGIHRSPRGSRAAIAVLNEWLDFSPSANAIWLLNIAAMTLGEYPDQVPVGRRVPPEALASEYDIKRFPDVAGKLGLAVDDLAGGVAMDDFDGDGWLDLVVSAAGTRSQIRYFRNKGDGTFEERTASAGLTGLMGGLNINHADYNNDGFPDVLVLRGGWQGNEGSYPNSLLRNNGDNTFTDVTEEAGLLSFHPTQTAAWFDYNGDGWLDLFIGNESLPQLNQVHPCELYRNNGDGTFTECAAENGLALVDFIKGVDSGDFDNDGRPDLYLSARGFPNRLLRNAGPAGSDTSPRAKWSFVDVTAKAGVAEPLHSFPCWFWDYDNDGWLDIFVSGYFILNAGDIAAEMFGVPHKAERPRLYRNNRDGTFRDVTKEAGLNRISHTMGSNFGDLDNDGWLDCYLGTGDPYLGTLIPNRMFRNNGGRTFQDVTTSGGFGQLQKGHGVAFGDLNHDGAQDVYAVIGGVYAGDHYPNQLFANPGHGNYWLKLIVNGVASNRGAVGARIKVVLRTPEGRRELHRVVDTGGSFGSNPLRQEIGLGRAEAIEQVEITWPVTGKKQILSGLQIDTAYRVREDQAEAERVPHEAFAWPGAGAAGGHHHHHHQPGG